MIDEPQPGPIGLNVAASRERWLEIPVRVELHYLSTGETIDATPTEKVTKNRTDKSRGHVKKGKQAATPQIQGRSAKAAPGT